MTGKQGEIKRKSSAKVLGKHTWNKRWVVILRDEIAFYESHAHVHKQLDSVSLGDVTSAQLLPKKKGRRFNVTTHAGGVVALLAESKEEAEEWVAAVCEAHDAHREAEAAAKAEREREEREAVAAAEAEAAAAERKEEELEAAAAAAGPVDVDAELGAAEVASGALVRMNAGVLRSASAVSFMSNASAVSEDTFESMRRMFFVLRAGKLTFYSDDTRRVPLGFVDVANVERVETYRVVAADVADDDILDAPNKPDGLRLYLGEEHELWELAVPETDDGTADMWVRHLETARDLQQKDNAEAAAAAGNNGGKAAAAAGGGAAAEDGALQEVDLEDSSSPSAEQQQQQQQQQKEEKGSDIKEEKEKKDGCHCIVM